MAIAVATFGQVAMDARARPLLAHRADIDGLRAVAVLPVLLFHAGFPTFLGGFVGVDVFFVISGYLITSIVLGEIAAGRFSLVGFYERRVRRIFPALFAVLLASVVIGVLVLLPVDLERLGQSVVATTLFTSNVLFWQEAGYFDAPAGQKPLLHTWSLAVEEQFYIVFPLAIWLLARARRNCLPYTVAALLASFGLAVVALRYSPSAAFYLAPTRAWELLLGAVLAMGALPPPGRQALRDSLSLLGLGLIAYSVLAFSPETPFPGTGALLPCLGAALVIFAGADGRSLGGRLLSAPPLVRIGLISYSLYLWHWPLLVLVRAYAVRELTAAETVAVLGLAFLAAYASWRWIERPFRGSGPVLAGGRALAGAGLAMALTAGLGLGLHLAQGLPQRLPAEATRLAAGAVDRNPTRGACLYPSVEDVAQGRLCRLGADMVPPSFILWGDSHAETLKAVVGEIAADAGRAGWFAGYPGCPPFLGVRVRSPNAAVPLTCRDDSAAMLDLAARPGIETVILAAHWSLYATGQRYEPEAGRRVYLGDDQVRARTTAANAVVFRRGLERTLEVLARHGKEAVIVAPIPEVESPVPETLALAAWHGRDIDIRPARARFDARQHAVLELLAEMSRRGLARVVYPDQALCDGERCRVASDGRALYADDNHLSLHGADAIRPILEGALVGPPP